MTPLPPPVLRASQVTDDRRGVAGLSQQQQPYLLHVCSAAMNPEDREAYLKKKKEETKQKLREIMKQKYVDAKKVRLFRPWNIEISFKCFLDR